MHRQIIVPTEKDHTIELPKEFFGKTVEVTVVEVNPAAAEGIFPLLPAGKTVPPEKLLETFGADPEFPDTGSIREKSWVSKW